MNLFCSFFYVKIYKNYSILILLNCSIYLVKYIFCYQTTWLSDIVVTIKYSCVVARPSSDVLHAAAVAGITCLGGLVVECGVVSTPVLHYRVLTANDGGRLEAVLN